MLRHLQPKTKPKMTVTRLVARAKPASMSPMPILTSNPLQSTLEKTAIAETRAKVATTAKPPAAWKRTVEGQHSALVERISAIRLATLAKDSAMRVPPIF